MLYPVAIDSELPGLLSMLFGQPYRPVSGNRQVTLPSGCDQRMTDVDDGYAMTIDELTARW